MTKVQGALDKEMNARKALEQQVWSFVVAEHLGVGRLQVPCKHGHSMEALAYPNLSELAR